MHFENPDSREGLRGVYGADLSRGDESVIRGRRFVYLEHKAVEQAAPFRQSAHYGCHSIVKARPCETKFRRAACRVPSLKICFFVSMKLGQVHSVVLFSDPRSEDLRNQGCRHNLKLIIASPTCYVGTLRLPEWNSLCISDSTCSTRDYSFLSNATCGTQIAI